MKKLLLSLLLALPMTAFSQSEFEEVSPFDQPQGYASLSLGLGLLEVSDASLGYGADLGLLFTNRFSFPHPVTSLTKTSQNSATTAWA